MADNYIDVTLSEIFGTGVASVEQTETSAEPGGYNVWTITLTNGHTSTFTVRNGTAGGSPMPVLNSADMVDTTGIYLYLGNEEGFVTGHWYCYANDAWTDFGAYTEKGDPGLAPTVEISKTDGTTTITITDAEGEHVAYIEDGISPTVKVANTAAEMTDTSLIYVYAGSEAAYNNGDWYIYDSYIGQWRSGGQYQASVPRVDQTLTVQGAAADSAKVGQEISDLKSQIAQGSGLTAEIKSALMNCINYVAWKDNDPNASQYISALQNALYPPANLSSISAVFTQGSNVIYDTDSLETLKQYLAVTAHYSDSTSETVTTYTLSGTLTVGTSTITVSYGGKTTTFNVTVTEYEEPPVSDGVYTPSEYIRGEYIDDTGAVTSASQGSAYIPDFIKMPTNYKKVVEFTNAPSSSGQRNWSIVEYDDTKNFIELLHYAATGGTHEPYFFYAVPVNAETSYIRLEWYHSSDETFVGTFSFYPLHDLPTEIGDVDATTGLDVVQPKRIRSGYIPVESAVAGGCPFKYEWKTPDDTYAWRCYDENHEYLGYVSVLNNKTVTLPTGTAYVRFIMQFGGSSHTFASGWSEAVINAIKIGNAYYWLTEE